VVSELEGFLVRHVVAGTVPGAVALRGGREPEVVAAGVASVDGDPMRDDAIMRIKSMTKAITSVAALRLVEAGRLGLDQSLEEWLPELADQRVLTSPTAPLDDTVPAHRPITLRHLLTMGSGYGMEFRCLRRGFFSPARSPASALPTWNHPMCDPRRGPGSAGLRIWAPIWVSSVLFQVDATPVHQSAGGSEHTSQPNQTAFTEFSERGCASKGLAR
jgi:hypothetical protein